MDNLIIIRGINQLLESEYQKSNQIIVEANDFVNDINEHKYRCVFIRYLQSQVDKLINKEV